jgi:hypothetical protein
MAVQRVIVPTIDLQYGEVVGVRFQAELSNGKARVSISETPRSIDPSQPDTFREILRELASVLMEAAQNPERILWHLPRGQ